MPIRLFSISSASKCSGGRRERCSAPALKAAQFVSSRLNRGCPRTASMAAASWLSPKAAIQAIRLTATAGLRIAKTEFQSVNEQGGPFNGAVTSASTQQSQRPVTPRFGLEYKPNQDFLLYTSAAKGFRIGGGNNPVPIQTCQADLDALGLTTPPSSFNSDTVWSYEIGAKGSTADRVFSFETSAFYIDWKDIQSSVPLNNCGFAFIANLGAAVSKGVDAHVTIAPVTGLTLDAAVGYTHARFTDDVQGAPTSTGETTKLVSRGDPLRVPPWTVSLAVDYENSLPFLDGADGYAHAEYNYAALYKLRTPQTFGYDPLDNRRDAVTLVNLRAGIRIGAVDASIFVNNLLNKAPLLYTERAPQQDLFNDVTSRPRTIGATVSLRF